MDLAVIHFNDSGTKIELSRTFERQAALCDVLVVLGWIEFDQHGQIVITFYESAKQIVCTQSADSAATVVEIATVARRYDGFVVGAMSALWFRLLVVALVQAKVRDRLLTRRVLVQPLHLLREHGNMRDAPSLN